MFNNRSRYPANDAPFPGNPRSANRSSRPSQNEPPKSLAPALRVKNFRMLRDELGEEHLAVQLGLSMHRLKELTEGINFSDEMAYHVETALGLPSGLMDRINPTLSDAELARLRVGLTEDSQEESSSHLLNQAVPALAAKTAAASPAALLAAPEPRLPLQATAEPAIFAPAASPAALPPLSTSEQLFPSPEPLTTLTQNKEPHMAQVKQNPIDEQLSDDELSLEMPRREIRRANFELLTSPKGAKSRLAALTGLSAANISHRLHGNKIFDKDTADYFCGYLVLPLGWFETPKEEDDIPLATIGLLTDGKGPAPARKPTSRSATKSKTGGIPTLLAASAAPVALAAPVASSTSSKEPRVSGPAIRVLAPRKVLHVSAGELTAPSEAEATSAERPTPVSTVAPQAPATAPKVTSSSSVTKAAPVATATPAPKATVPTAAPAEKAVLDPTPNPGVQAAQAPQSAPLLAQAPVYRPVTARTAETAGAGSEAAFAVKFSGESSVGPIAQALLHTLAMKARTGNLSEDKALQMLVDAATM